MKTTDQIIDAYQAQCLGILEQVTAELGTEISRLTTENETLAATVASGSKEISRLTWDLAERDRWIGDLQAAGAKQAEEEAEEDLEEEESETVARLEAEFAEARTELESVKADLKTHEDADEEEETELEKLQASIPEAEALAAVVHNFLRADRVLPANLDVPFRITPHAYRMGLEGAVAEELPS